MELSEFASQVEQGLAQSHMVIAFVKCQVRYNGRVQSILDEGDRVLMIKPDKTLLVHQPTKHVPVNYMKADTQHALVVDDGEVIVSSMHVKNKEIMKVHVTKVYHMHSGKLHDPEGISVQGTESDMSQFIIDNPTVISESFIPVGREEQTKYGFIDVVGHEDGVLVVIECKRYTADLSAVTQLRRYVERVMASKGISEVKAVLAAPRITPQAHAMLQDWGYSFKKVIPPHTNNIRHDARQKKLKF